MLEALELDADLLGDHAAGGEDGHVLEHLLAAVPEAGRLHRHALERAAELVDDEGGQGLAFHVLGHEHDRRAGAGDLFEDAAGDPSSPRPSGR